MRQRADLTYKQNVQHGRHGWLRLTPAYSVRLVDQVLAEFGAGARRVFEPFSGTGTTPLCAAYRGLAAVSTDINPFLIWLGRVKCARYTASDQQALAAASKRIGARLLGGKGRPGEPPPLKNIERWWNPAQLEFVTALRGEVARVDPGVTHDLLTIAFCRTMMALSNAAFNHQSMSFKKPGAGEPATVAAGPETARFVAQFMADAGTVAESCVDNPEGEVRIERGDARGLAAQSVEDGSFDLLITSPPYPNRMSYIRELRPYMYWLGYLGDARAAGELDWEAIGGTWGIATSRLAGWRPGEGFIPAYLPPIIEQIRGGHPKNGGLMAQYVHKYFADMFLHFQAAAKIVRPGGTAHYIVGNSSFYGHIVPAERLYVDQLLAAGFRGAHARAIRKRSSKKELVEYHVIAER